MKVQAKERKRAGISKSQLSKNKVKKIAVRVRAKAPASSSCEIPILRVLASDPINGKPAKDVIKQVRGWFDTLNKDDLDARYPASRKKIADTITKFCKKNLVLKNQIYQVGEEGAHWHVEDN